MQRNNRDHLRSNHHLPWHQVCFLWIRTIYRPLLCWYPSWTLLWVRDCRAVSVSLEMPLKWPASLICRKLSVVCTANISIITFRYTSRYLLVLSRPEALTAPHSIYASSRACRLCLSVTVAAAAVNHQEQQSSWDTCVCWIATYLVHPVQSRQ